MAAGGDDSANIRAAAPAGFRHHPAGDRLDLRSLNYFPAAVGDSWITTASRAASLHPARSPVTSSNVTSDGYTVSETTPGAQPDTETYRRTTAGQVLVDIVDLTAPAVARNLIGEILMYPEPFYPVGGTRTVVRQGSWGPTRTATG